MSVTVTTTESWTSRLGDSFKGILTGLAVFVAGFPLLFWNEGRAVKTARALDEGEGACISLENASKVDVDYEGKLVHITDRADTKDMLEDDIFGISENAICLKRDVEIFQWVEDSHSEEHKKLGGKVEKTTTYTYKQQWCDTHVDSSRFHEAGHENPPMDMEFKDAKLYASNVNFGAFRFNQSQIESIGGSVAYTFETNFVPRINRAQVKREAIYVPNYETRSNPLNRRDVAAMPRLGDYRVKFSVIKPHTVSVIAQQKGDGFTSYITKNGTKLLMITDGDRTAAEMFNTAREGNNFMTWALRIIGFLMMAGGLSSVFKPLSVIADVLPILGDIVEVGTGIVAKIIAFVCAVTTIAIAWLFYRPIIGIALLLIAGVGVFFLVKKRNEAKSKAAGKPAAAAEAPAAESAMPPRD